MNRSFSTAMGLGPSHRAAFAAANTIKQRMIAFAAASTIVVAVAFSRLYLGVHYPSDVLGGFCAGLAWLMVCGATRRFVVQHRAGRTAL